MRSSITVRPDSAYGVVRPELYGHFAEHLGRCIYEGIWVGEESPIPNDGGIRCDTVNALKRIRPPILRWPGGCFADVYHWEDGIGPRDQRPKRPNHWWEGEDTNAFGTHEYLETCERLGAEPFICLNVGSGTPREALNWVEYCTYSGDTEYTRKRARNGHPLPWNVHYWAVGNENWGCGGKFEARDYAREYRRFVSFLKQTAPQGEFVICGFDQQKWNLDVLDELRDDLGYIDHISIHRYVSRGTGSGFTPEEYWLLLKDVSALEDVILMTSGTVQSFTQYSKRYIGIALDEWGVWHRDATVDRGLSQPNTLRDAIFAASAFHMFQRHASILSMTNIAQTINVLQCLLATDGDKLALTPTYYVYDLLQPHKGATAIVTEVDGPSVEVTDAGRRSTLPVLDASATASPDGTMTISVINRHPSEAQEGCVKVAGSTSFPNISARCLGGTSPGAENKPGATESVAPAEVSTAPVKNGEFVHTFPPCSVTVFRLSHV